MGNYATATNLKARFESDVDVAHLTDTPDSGVPDEDVLNEVIDHAEGEIDSCIARQYLIPVAVADHTGLAAIMKSKTLDVAVFYLYARGHRISDATQKVYDAAMKWCEAVAKGEVPLPTPDTEPATASREPLFDYGTAGTGDDSRRLFSRETQDRL